MAVSEEADEQVLHQLFLSDNDLSHFHGEKVHEGAFPLDAVIEFLDINTIHHLCYLISYNYICEQNVRK